MSVARLPKRAAGCEDCARLERNARAARGDAANRRRVLARHTDDDLTARYTAEYHEFSARADEASTDYIAHHAEAHPIPAVVLHRTDNDQAPSHRKPALPRAAVLAERLRAGETLEQIAESFDRSTPVIARRLTQAGFNSRTGRQRNHRDSDGLLIPADPWDFPEWFDRALCAQTDPEAFFPEQGGSTVAAKAICALCPTRTACLQYAIDHRIRHGIWGGLSERDRRKLERAAS